MKIVVIGGSGLIGSKLVQRLREDGHEPLAAAPDTGVNTLTGEGLDEALEGAQVVVDVANAPDWGDAAVLDFFKTSARNVLAAEAAAGVKHHVALSVVGADRLPGSGYLRAKVAQEETVKAGSVPYTILRATQFFEFVGRIVDSSTDDGTVRLAPVFVQPESADDVAAALADVAEGEPVNGIVELGGPEQFRFDELARRFLDARNDPRPVTVDAHAQYFGTELDDHSLTPGDDARIAPTRFEDWLSQAVAGWTTPHDREETLMKPTIVLVHGAFAESASWNGVIDSLASAGHPVIAAANPLRSVDGDAAAVADLVRTIEGPVVLVAHSYGGAVISNVPADAGDITGLVYVCGFAPDAGESCFALAGKFPGSMLGEKTLHPVPRSDGTTDLYINEDRFHELFCPDVPASQAAQLAATQRPATQEALFAPSGEQPLWREVPSWFLIGEEDRIIPAQLQHFMAERAGARRTLEIPGASHAAAVSEPQTTAELILEAVTVPAAV
jgi:uncharacterized protein YbjT (DUF2867 family)